MNIEQVKRVANGEDTVEIAKKLYVVRFSAKHAQHITDNLNDSAHHITFGEIVNLLKVSVVLPTSKKKELH